MKPGPAGAPASLDDGESALVARWRLGGLDPPTHCARPTWASARRFGEATGSSDEYDGSIGARRGARDTQRRRSAGGRRGWEPRSRQRRGRHRKERIAGTRLPRRRAPRHPCALGRVRSLVYAAATRSASRHRPTGWRTAPGCSELIDHARSALRHHARRASPPRADHRGGDRRRPLGGRGHAGPSQVPRPAHSSDACPTRDILSRRRGRPHASAPRRSRSPSGDQCATPALGPPVVAGCRRVGPRSRPVGARSV